MSCVMEKDMKRMSCTLTRLCLLHHSNSAIMLLFGIITHHASGSFELNVTVPLRGSPVRANCTLPGSAVGVTILFNSLGTLQEPAQCRPDLNHCVPSSYPNTGLVFYYLSAGSNSAWIDILSLDRIRDQAIWRCLLGNQTTLGTVNLTVFTSPKGVKYVQPILLDGDLGQESVTLICETVNCTYPAPQISWYYLTAEQKLAQYSETEGTIGNNTSLCDQLEAIYTSTLHLTRGTTFKENIDFTTKFACGVRHPALDVDIIYSNFSNYIKFAVNLTSVILKDMNGSYLPSMVELVEGSVVTLNCVTSTSRPTATVRWYIGKTNIISGIENVVRPGGSGLQYIESKLTFTPSNAEYHNKSIYCQAYSYLNYSVIESTQHILFVKVNVTQAELKQSNRTVEDTLNVTSWEPVTLMCVTGFSRPAPIINWYIESQWKGNGTSLSFTASNEDHNKTIYCSAYNIDPSRPAYSGKPRLYVKVSVRVIYLESSTNGTFVFYDGFSQRLKCTGSPSRPLPTIKWMLESQAETVPLTDNITNTDVTDVDGLYVWTSEITHIFRKKDQNKNISCSGSVDGQQVPALSNKVTIDVLYQPNKPEVQEYGVYFPWLENQNGTLQCNSIDYGNPSSDVNWTSNRGITDAIGHHVIMGLMWSDNRQMVSCELVNRYTIDKDVHAVSEPITLNVEYSPRIQFNTNSPLTVNETQFLNVSCNATGNPNPNQIFWSGRPDGSLLRFENISRNDNGTYTCTATANSSKHGMLRSQMEFNIIVQYAPVMKVTNVSSTQQNMTSLITCEASGVPAVYTFCPWKHMWGETIIRSGLRGMPTGNTSLSQNILKLERLSLQDMGTYVCSAENRIKGINGEFIQIAAVDLDVMGAPTFLREETNKLSGGIGDFINISIPFYSYSNVTSFMFKKNGTVVMNTSRTSTHLRSAIIDYTLYDSKIQLTAQEAHLYIQNLTQEDFDNYTLILENSQGPAEFIVTLDSFGPPLMVERFYLNRLEDYIELHFDPGFNGGHIQVFVIQYKSETSLEDWKNTSILQETQTQYLLPNGTFAVNITKPSPGSYIYRMYSWNEINRSPYSPEIRVFIPEGIKPPQGSSQVAAIAGGIGAAVLVIVVATIVIVVIKRRNQSSDEASRREIKERPESGLIENPVYDTSDNLPSPSTSTSAVGTEYAVVVKSKHHQKVAKTEDPSGVYAQVEKKKMKTDKNGASKGKLGKASRGDIYENATIVKGSTSRENVYENSKSATVDSSSETMYENPGATSGKDPKVNKDDLHYADLMLGPATTKAGNPVIHGSENRTEYAKIAYGKRGEPLPESEDEQKSGATKKNNST